MSIPNDAVLQDIIDDVIPLGFLSGTDATIALAAMETSVDIGQYALGTNLLQTGTDCDIQAVPTGWADFNERFGLLELRRTNLVSVSTVTIRHDQFRCDCEDEDISGCVHIYHELYSHVRLEDCLGPADCSCAGPGRPVRVEICYLSGKWATVADLPRAILLALGLMAQFYTGVMETSGDQASSAFIDKWSSMDYNESRGFIRTNVIGESPQLAMAWKLIRRHRTMRAPVARGHHLTQPPRRGYA